MVHRLHYTGAVMVGCGRSSEYGMVSCDSGCKFHRIGSSLAGELISNNSRDTKACHLFNSLKSKYLTQGRAADGAERCLHERK